MRISANSAPHSIALTDMAKPGPALLALERELLSSAARRSRDRLKALLADDFVEFGSSGRVYDRNAVIEVLGQSDESETFEIEDFRLVTSDEVTAFVSYRCVARSEAGQVLRTSNRIDNRWQMVFHQGTNVE